MNIKLYKISNEYKSISKWDYIKFGKESYLFKIQYKKYVKTYIYISKNKIFITLISFWIFLINVVVI